MTLVEQICRALATQHYAERFRISDQSLQVQVNVNTNWHTFSDQAVTALKAMREPTTDSAIADAMNDVWVDTVDGEINVCLADCCTLFTAAIDAALTEQEQTP